MTGPVVRGLADVEAVARSLGMTPVHDDFVAAVYGRWTASGVDVMATEQGVGWVACAVEVRDRKGTRLYVARFEGCAPVQRLHDLLTHEIAVQARAAA